MKVDFYMRGTNLFLFFTVAFALSSCTVQQYFQEYETVPLGGSSTPNGVIFEDENCRFTYNLWSHGGWIEVAIFNKSTYEVEVDLAKCFFVLNGLAREYYQNASYTRSAETKIASESGVAVRGRNVSVGVREGIAITSENSITQSEKQIMTIPSSTRIELSYFNVRFTRYNDCDLRKYPTKNKTTTLNFDESDSPIRFSNLITYYIGRDTSKVKHDFFVSKISEKHSDRMQTYKDTTNCGEMRMTPIKVFRNPSADKFYIEYYGD